MMVGQKNKVMRKIILGLAVSLDGFIEGPGGEYDWCFTDQDYGLSALMKRVDTLFMGRKTYEVYCRQSERGMPGMKEYVFSETLEKVKEGSHLIRGDIKKEIEKIKLEAGKDIWLFGGASLTTSLMNFHLVDEIHLALHPILLGGGKPLFQNLKGRMELKLIEYKRYSMGLVSLVYVLA